MIRQVAVLNTAQVEWFSDPAFPLSVRHWDDDYVVYHPGSGDTHLLDASRYLLLTQLGREPAPVTVIAKRLAARLELPDDVDFTERVETLLSDLYGLGLIEKVG
jgi:PqqD family protein of HPr-rel-A system